MLLVTRSYPSVDNLYQYPFVHRRVLAYLDRGHSVLVFRLTGQAALRHLFEGVICHSGDAEALAACARDFGPDVIAAHGLSETMWEALAPLETLPMRFWLHGSEIPAFFRAKAMAIARPDERALALRQVAERAAFWQAMLGSRRAFKLVFPSQSAVTMFKEDIGGLLLDQDYRVIANPIDTDLFAYLPKTSEQRRSILSIRPYDSSTYGNDLAVEAINLLSRRADFACLRFTFIGDGPLFEETLAPLRRFTNVRIERRFLLQSEIALQHRTHGIFLVPTRLDTQGVSRDEAMSSGLVPVTNDLPVVREFADEQCCGLAPPENPHALAREVAAMLDDPGLFARRSEAAAATVRASRSHSRVTTAELQFLREAVDG